LFLLSLLFSAIYTYILVNHIVKTTDYKTKCLYNVVPCFLLYNTFGKSENFAYTITLVVFLGLGIGTCLY
jgi:hypothetical protein